MPKLFAQRLLSRRSAAVTLSIAAAGVAAVAAPATASASTSQIAMIQDGGVVSHPDATFQQFRELGATMARIIVPWSQIAPDNLSFTKPAFDATNPDAYPAGNWAPYDTIVRDAQKYGIRIDFTVTGGAPQWAEAAVPGGYDPYFAYKPNAQAYGQFMQAVATRYDGGFTPAGQKSPLPAVRYWAIFNEPNFGEDLGPQAINGSRVSVGPMLYRGILNAGWNALQATGHGHDTITIGGYAARGMSGRPTAHAPQGFPGNFAQTKPLQFIRTLYCVDSKYKQLRGSYAKARGCPKTRAASKRFRAQNPALFKASGMADHPYPDNGSPVRDGKGDPDFATFPDLGNFGTVIDKVNAVYGSHRRFPIYNDEYGYITHPPARSHYVSPTTAAYYINWAEYLSYKNSRLKSYMQYLLQDPPTTTGPYAGFASGLEYPDAVHKPTYAAYILPFYMPRTTFSHRNKVEVWGAVRPAATMASAGHGTQTVALQESSNHHAYVTIKTFKITKSGGYFDTRMKFKKSGGSLRLVYTYPNDALLPPGVSGSTVISRSFNIKVH